MLQRPRVAKHFSEKRFGDRLFLEAGIGLQTSAGASFLSPANKPSLQTGIAVGDWVTPLHGWRIGAQVGKSRFDTGEPFTYGASADYLLNLTALAVPTSVDSAYSQRKRLEFIASVGIDFVHSRGKDLAPAGNAIGGHIGLRAQYRLSDYSYIYIEPRVGAGSDKLAADEDWRDYRFNASLMAGLGYGIAPGRQSRDTAEPYTTSGHFLDDAFISFSAGPSTIIGSDPSLWSDHIGPRAALHLGKWFNAYSGARLGAQAAMYRQEGHPYAKALSVSAGYLWNMHNTFAGYDPEREFWLNAVADVSLNASSSHSGKHWTPGVGLGLQANFRVAHGVDLFIEPRLDAYKKEFATFASSTSDLDVAATVMAGLAFRQGRDTRQQLERNGDFDLQASYDHLFFEGGLGAVVPVVTSALRHPFDYTGPKAFVAVGKWFNATSGVRLWGEGARMKPQKNMRLKTAAIGADYLWNMSNAFHGYNPDRRFELVGALGADMAFRSGSHTPYAGLNAGLKGIWHANDMWGLFLEPQARLYADKFSAATSFLKMDATAALVAGVQLYLKAYNPIHNRELFNTGEAKNAFFSMAGGSYVRANGFRDFANYGALGRISYGRWFSPVSAWRANISGSLNPRQSAGYAALTVGADYLCDFYALTKGYDEDRLFSLRGLLGLNMGTDYKRREDFGFAADMHAGAQLAFRTSPAVEVYLEPQCAYRLDGRYEGRWGRVMPSLVAGLNYRFRPIPPTESRRPALPGFISAAIGTGVHSATVARMSPAGRKLTLDFDFAYGRWLTGLHGYRLGLSDATVQQRGHGNRHLTALHVDYISDFLALAGAEQAASAGFRLTGIVGTGVVVSSRKGYSPSWAPVFQAGVQVGQMLSKRTEIFLEPLLSSSTKRLIPEAAGKMQVEAKLQAGVKYHF